MNLYINDVHWTTKGVPEVPTLQDICLECIYERLCSFNTGFHIFKDAPCELQRLLEFFRRNYSQHIINAIVAERGILHARYYEFLINEYLTKLDWSIFETQHLNGVLQRLPGNNLENVSFKFAVQDQDTPRRQLLKQHVREALQHLSKVKVMQIKDYCDNTTLATIYSVCKELKKLCLIHCSISDDGLRSLCPNDKKSIALNLQTLVLKDINKNCDDGTSYLLRNLRSLECVYYDNLLHVLYVGGLRRNIIANLTSVGFYVKRNIHDDMNYFNKVLKRAYMLCPSISKVNIHGKISENQLQMLHIFSNLRAVYVCTGSDNTLDVSSFLQYFGDKMRILKISRCQIRLSTLFENCRNMESVLLEQIDYDIPENQNSDYILSNITSFVMFHPFNEETVGIVTEKFLDSCPSLTEIDITGYNDNQETGGIVERYCARSETLEKLAFTSGSIESESFTNIISSRAPLRIVIANEAINVPNVTEFLDDVNAIPRNVVIKQYSILIKDEEDMENNCCVCND